MEKEKQKLTPQKLQENLDEVGRFVKEESKQVIEIGKSNGMITEEQFNNAIEQDHKVALDCSSHHSIYVLSLTDGKIKSYKPI